MTDAPLLLLLAAGRQPHPRKAPFVWPKEITLHLAVAKIKAMGGPDFVLVPPIGQLHGLELKREGGGLTPDQEEFRVWCVHHGIHYVVANDLDQVLVAFDRWGCLRIKIGGAR